MCVDIKIQQQGNNTLKSFILNSLQKDYITESMIYIIKKNSLSQAQINTEIQVNENNSHYQNPTAGQ